MNSIYIIHINPETGLIDYEKPVKTLEILRKTVNYYYLSDGRKIKINSDLYQFFDDEKVAMESYVAQLLNVREHLKNELRKVHKAILRSPHSYSKGEKRKRLVKVTHPDGKITICTRARACDIAGLSYQRVSGVISQGATTRKGFKIEWQ